MKAKLLLLAILLTTVLSFTGTAFAVTDAERSALIAQIRTQIAQLQAQLNQMLQDQQGGASWCHTFNTNLGFANSGSDEVFQLHTALQKENISYGSDSAMAYTEDTSDAVIQFQAKYGISRVGYVGPTTRAKLNQLYGCARTNEIPPAQIPKNPQAVSNAVASTPDTTQTQTQAQTQTQTPAATTPPAIVTEAASMTVDLKASGMDGTVYIDSGSTLALTWTSTGAVSCVGGGKLSGNKATSGSELVPNMASSGYYKIICTDSQRNTKEDSITVGIRNPTVIPTVDVNVNNSNGPLTVEGDVTVKVTWTSTNAASCAFSGGTMGGAVATSGTVDTGISKAYASYTIILTCASSSGATVSDTVIVNVSNPDPPDVVLPITTPTAITLLVDGQDGLGGPIQVLRYSTITVSWTAANVISCTASSSPSGKWFGAKAVSGGEEWIMNLDVPVTLTLRCTNFEGQSESKFLSVGLAY